MDGWTNVQDFLNFHLSVTLHTRKILVWGWGYMYQCALHVCLLVFCSPGKHWSFLQCSIHCHWCVISSYTDTYSHKFVNTHSYTHNSWPWSYYRDCTSIYHLTHCVFDGVGDCLLLSLALENKVLCDKSLMFTPPFIHKIISMCSQF